MSNVLMVLPRYIPIIGGAEVQCRRLIQELKKNSGMKVVGVVTRRVDKNLGKKDIIDDIKVSRLPPLGTGIFAEYIFCMCLFMYLLFNKNKYDVIHCHASSIFGMTCSLVGCFLGKKVIVKVSTNGEIKSMQNSRFKSRIVNFTSRHCTYVALNQEGYDEVSTYLKNATAVIIPNGIDFNSSHELDKSEGNMIRSTIQDKFGNDIFICVFIGRFVKRKGINELYKLGGCLLSNKKVVFVLVGDSELQRDAVKLSETSADNIIIAGRQENIFPYLFAADLFISPSHQEGLPNTVLEALSVGVECLLSDIWPHRELFEEHQNKIHLFEKASVISLQNSLANIVKSHEKYNSKKEVFLVDKYSIKNVAKQYSILYKDEFNARH